MQWYVFAILSAIISGLVPFIDKKILRKMSVANFSSIYSATNFLMSLALLYFIDITFNWKIIGLIFIGSVFASMGFYIINRALKKYDVSLVSPLRSFNPVILLVLAIIFLGETMTLIKAIGILMISLGAYIIEARNILHKPFEPLKTMFKSSLLFLILASATFYAISSMLDKIILSQYEVLSYMVLIHFFIMLNFFILNIFQTKKVFSWNNAAKSTIWMIVLASFLTLAYRFFFAQAVSLAFVSLVVPIKHMDSLVSTIIGGEMLHEKHLRKKIVAAGIMFIGVLLVVLKL